MRMTLLLATSFITLAGCAGPSADAVCRPVDGPAMLPDELPEASGLAPSQDSGLLWIHNDSDNPARLFAIAPDGSIRSQVRLPGAGTQRQWEDISAGPCPTGTCLYIADIGDNEAAARTRRVIRVPHPAPGDSVAHGAEQLPFRYPDGPVDAEALFVLPDTSIFIVTKGRQGPITVYRFPRPLQPGSVATLERVQQLTDALVQMPGMVTGASATPDGAVVAIRSYGFLQLYAHRADTLAPLLEGPGVSLESLGEPQGEAVALLPDGTVYLATERGPFGSRPFLSRLRCEIPEST